MPQYRYQALNANQQPVSGEITADGFADALSQLAAQGLAVQALVDMAVSEQAGLAVSSVEDQVAWQQQLLKLLERGRELLPPLKAFVEELPVGQRRRQLELLTSTLERGNIPADAMATLQSLPGYWIPLLSAATASRDPGRILREFLRETEQAEQLRRQWRQTLAYPLLLISLAVAVLIGLSIIVIPIFRNIFDGFGIRVPLPTRLVLVISEWITSGRVLVVIVVGGLLSFGLYRACRWLSPALRESWADRFALWIGHSTAIARFAQFTADLLEAEVSPEHALRLAGLATGSGPIQRAAVRVAAGLTSSTEEACEKNRRVLTRTVHYALVTPNSKTGRMRLLREIGASYAERMSWRLSWARGFVEPLAICLVGLIVGGVAFALFLPLFSLLHALA
ncbi:type II secretion system F family protein [Anatilimnocola floriformis]|uniref:type II secretion system F family protein n=1 Tax=Anatilimnocola floriformis TaxID=2948575 RepID=UPI0020C1E3E3|nr:type II secretion system F family protein [Anatilimnocola floriformis]